MTAYRMTYTDIYTVDKGLSTETDATVKAVGLYINEGFTHTGHDVNVVIFFLDAL